MNFRLKTTTETAEHLKNLQNSTHLNPNILARMAVGLSISRHLEEPAYNDGDNGAGLEFNRYTLTGEHDDVYKALVTQHAGREVSDNEFFPNLFNAHLERGIKILSNEYSYTGNAERFFYSLLNS